MGVARGRLGKGLAVAREDGACGETEEAEGTAAPSLAIDDAQLRARARTGRAAGEGRTFSKRPLMPPLLDMS